MKRTAIRKIGKIGKANLEANKLLKILYENSDIRSCEIAGEGCENWILNYCHRHDREWYKGDVELLSSFNQTIIGCQKCHGKMDTNKKEREEIFLKLRGEE
ncbi:MAG: hypothetical protein WC823_00105 [Parcubacteria group bacterium]|jgi:hypothetical protein